MKKNATIAIALGFHGDDLVETVELYNVTVDDFRRIFNLSTSDPVIGASFPLTANTRNFFERYANGRVLNPDLDWFVEFQQVTNKLETEADYEKALKKLEELWVCNPVCDTPEFYSLVDLIEEYEEEHYPIVDEEQSSCLNELDERIEAVGRGEVYQAITIHDGAHVMAKIVKTSTGANNVRQHESEE